MVKKDRADVRQMKLDLNASLPAVEFQPEVKLLEPVRTNRVIPFLDATTLALRRMAVQSVQKAGIFDVGPLRKS